MPIKYRKSKIILGYQEGKPTVFKAQQISYGTLGLDKLVAEIAHAEGVNETQTLSVITALVNRIAHYVELGYGVRVGDLGSFKLQMNAKCTKTKEEATADTIKRFRVNFRPGKKLLDVTKTVTVSDYETLDAE